MRQIADPVGLVVAIILGRFVLQFAVDQVLQRAEEGRRDGFAGDQRRVDGCNAIAEQCDAGSVRDYVVHAREEEEILRPRLKQGEFEQRASEWHRRALNGMRDLLDFIHGMVRVTQVMEGQVDFGVVDWFLEHLTVDFDAADPERFGLPHHTADGPLEGITIYRPLDSDEKADLPLCARMTRFIREPYVELSARQRKRAVVKFHPAPPATPRIRTIYWPTARPASLSRRLLGRISGQFCSM